MPYVTSVERIGIEKGLQQGLHQGLQQGLHQGLQQGEQNLLLRMLTRRFGSLPDDMRERLQSAVPEQLEEWGERLLDAATLEDVWRK